MSDESRENPNIEGDRHISSLTPKRSKKRDLGFFLLICVVAGLVLFFNFYDFSGSKEIEPGDIARVEKEYRVTTSSQEPYKPQPTVDDLKPAQNTNNQMSEELLGQLLEAQKIEAAQREQAAKEFKRRLDSDMLLFSRKRDDNLSAHSINNNIGSAGNPGSSGLLGGSGSNDPASYVNGTGRSTVETVQAYKLNNTNNLILQGTLIPGILETAINSSLPGMIRAVITKDVYSFDGKQVLLTRGSQIVGRQQSSVKRGQNRIFVVWNRITRPDGVSIMVDSPGADYLGRAGLGGDVDTRFMERFGSAILLSLLDGAIQAGVNAANDNDAQTVITNSSSGLNRSAEIALENTINLSPIIHVDQGTPIDIFVAKDMDFSSVGR